jgi:very-short-patch-repair endonuclease
LATATESLVPRGGEKWGLSTCLDMSQASQRNGTGVWSLASSQHGVISRCQLLQAGLSSDQIDSRIRSGRLHRTWRGVYALGRPELSIHGWWMAAVLACGSGSLLSHDGAAALWEIRATKEEGAEGKPPRLIHVSVPGQSTRVRAGIRVHRRRLRRHDRAVHHNIPVTSPALTLIDLAAQLQHGPLEAAVNEADKLGRVDPETLRAELGKHRGLAGVGTLRRLLDQRTFRLTDSELERLFLRLVRRAGLPEPLTQQRINGFRVDFYWPDLGLVVETDGLRYHRTPSQQARDRLRDQAHVAAGFTVLRFTHAQIRFEPEDVINTLRAVVERCRPRLVDLPGK